MSRSLHLVAVNWRDMRNPEAGGAERHLHEILMRMVERGHRVAWFSERYKGASEFDCIDGIDVVRRGTWWNANFTLPGAVKAYLRRERADLVIEDINKIPFLMPLHTDVRVVPVIPHLFGSTVFRETNPVFASYVYVWEKLIPWVYRHCNFVVISPSTKEDLVARGIPAEQIDVVLCGIDHERYHLPDSDERHERPTIVHFGRIRKYKGVDIVIRAFAAVRERVPDARLVIIGDGPEMPAVEKLAADVVPDGAVEFTGRMPTADMVAFLGRSHLFMNASPKEGWGLTVIEASACGVPVVGSDRPGLKDSILHEKTGFLVPYGDVEAFADRAVALLTDKDLWARMSRAGVEWASTFSWERCADEMETLFQREAR